MSRLTIALAMLGAGVMVPVLPLHAQQETQEQYIARLAAEKERDVAEKDRLTAQKDLVTAQTAYIEALPIPGFENTTTLEGDAGSMEAAMLSAEAMGFAARGIADRLDGKLGDEVVVMTSGEVVDLALADTIMSEIGYLDGLLDLTTVSRPTSPPDPIAGGGVGIGVAGAISLVTELSKLLGNESTISYKAAAEVDSLLLATAVAGRLNGRAYSPSATLGLGKGGRELLAQYEALANRMRAADARQAAIEKKKPAQQSPAEKTELATLKQALGRHAALAKQVATPTDKGVLPIHQAAKAISVFADGRTVLQVEVEKAGGSLVNSKNIGTMFGDDPVRVTGGVIVSYRLFDPREGKVEAAGVLNCATTRTSLGSMHRRTYKIDPAKACRWAG
ncbi:MAG: hypothetical protein H6919_11435 [Sphingomonadaceae bacterium]|nr:hypothetical protein [Sphingomonadaceae bacterium]MCP5383564.1 hypothetical protein [Altererythrobacter sp.]MCP5394506.1 hypothetical protein [Sphingomonadaceae bacterium]